MRNLWRASSAMAVFALAASFSSISSAGPVQNPVPAEVFAATPGLQGASISPNGKRIAAKMELKGEQMLVVMSLDKSEQPHLMSAGDLDINEWDWVTDDWLALGLGNTEYVGGIEIYVTRLASVSADLATFHKIDWEHSGQFADDVIWIAQDGSPHLLLSKETGLFHIEDVTPSVYDVDVSTGKAKPPSIFLPSGKAVGFVDAGGFDSFGEISMPTFTPTSTIFHAPGYDVDTLIVTPDQSQVLGVRYTSTGRRSEWFDPALKQVQQDLDERAGAGNAHIISFSKDRSKLLVEMSEPSQAGAVYLWDTKVGIPSFLAWINPALKDRHMNPVKTIQYKAQDGTPIQAVLTLPRGEEATNLPLIVMPHGGPGARDSETFDWWAQYLAEQGYAVIQPNYRGSTGFGTYFNRLGEGEMGKKMQDDLLDAITWASTSGIGDSKRVCIVGASYGGYAAMRGAQRDGSHYRCAISYAGVSDINAMMKYDKAFFIGTNPKRYWKTLAPDLAEVSPLNHPSDFSVPILVMHGAKDKRVPVKQSRTLVAALQKAGRNVTYVEQPLGDHHFTRGEDRLEFLKTMKAFLDKYNPA